MNNNWSTAANWDLNTVPTVSNDVIVPSGLTNYPTISSAVTVNTIVINSGTSLIANATVTTTNEVTYIRHLPTTNWYLIGSQLNGETIQDIIANHTFSSLTGSQIGIGIYTNNDATPWFLANAASTGSVSSGIGIPVKLAASGYLSMSESINVTNVSFPITTGTRNNFNVVANPFTSYINSTDFINSNPILEDDTIWLLQGGQYLPYNSSNPIFLLLVKCLLSKPLLMEILYFQLPIKVIKLQIRFQVDLQH